LENTLGKCREQGCQQYLRRDTIILMAKKGKKQNTGQVIIPTGHPNPPEPHEMDTAWVVASHFGCIIEFLVPTDDFKRKTPDCVICGILAEIKSPLGNSRKNTVREQFERASGQGAAVLVFDGRRTKLKDSFLSKEIQKELLHRKRIKKVIFVSKEEKVVEFVR
jgi:hypothetical protein